MSNNKNRFKHQLTKAKVNKFKRLSDNMGEYARAVKAGMPASSFRNYKKWGRQLSSLLDSGAIDDKDLSEHEALYVELFRAATDGKEIYKENLKQIMFNEAMGKGYYIDENGDKIKTNWVPAKELYHMVTFSTHETTEEREEEQEMEQEEKYGLIASQSAADNPAEFFREQQKLAQELARKKRKEFGDDE